MPRSCFVPFCKNRGKIAGIRFFKLSDKRRLAWLQAIGRNPKETVSRHNVICSEHFSREDFLESGKLRDEAIPSLKLKPERPAFTYRTPLDIRFSKSEVNAPSTSFQPTIDKELGIISVINEPSTSHVSVERDDTAEKSDAMSCASTISLETQNNKPQHSSSDSVGLQGSAKKKRRLLRLDHAYSWSPRKMKLVLVKTKSETSALRTRVRVAKQRIGRLQTKVRSLSSLVAHLRNKKFINDEAMSIIEKSCSGIPAALLKRIFDNSKRNKVSRKPYDLQLRSFAMTLSFYSTKAYEYVRNTFKLALPSLSSIRNWMSNVECLPGFSQTSFDLITAKVTDNLGKNKNTICALMLDEMAIKKQIDFVAGKSWGYVDFGSEITDDNVDCATEALVLMIVALNDSWKLPIGYFLIKALTGATKANIIKEALVKLHEVGVTVTSITCDGPNANFTMMSTLGAEVSDVNNLKPYFKHPVIQHEDVFVILDACHMLKLMRNCWATLENIIDEDGGLIDFNLIKKLHDLQEQEMLRFGNKLKKAHLEWQRQKMKVNLAAQTMSKSVADSLEFLRDKMKHPEFQNCEATIQFLIIINNCFDLLNSRNPFAKGCHTPLKSINEKYWRPILLRTINYLKGLKNKEGRPLYLTQYKTPIRGFVITIESLLGVYDKYINTENAPLKYILTYKVSQDHLELFFCSIRARNGWNNNPTAFQFYHTYKRLLVRHDLRNLKGNCTMQDKTHILSQTITTSLNREVQNISLDDIHIIKKYELDLADVEIGEHDYAIPQLPELSLLTQNVVGYIAGFVVKMIKRHIKCDDCIYSLHSVASSSSTMDDALLLLNQKDRGGLIKPSDDLLSALLITEKMIKNILIIYDEKLPAENNFYHVFSHLMAMKMFGENKLFSSLADHVANCSIYEENHVMRLLKVAVLCYAKIRLFHVAKRQTEKIRGNVIRKQLSKTILFSHQ